MNHIRLNNSIDWKKIKEENLNKNEIIIFKFSDRCSISFRVFDFFKNWNKNNLLGENVITVVINVVDCRTLSNEISSETGIIHESPQIIWLGKNGEVLRNASHFEIQNMLENLYV